MITGDRSPDAGGTHGAPDCLVEMAMAWLVRPLGGQTQHDRAQAIDEICLVLAQMRHRDPRIMELERARWVQRVTVRLCQQGGAPRGYDGAIQVELERRVLAALLAYRNWREQIAPVVKPMEHTGPSESGQVAA